MTQLCLSQVSWKQIFLLKLKTGRYVLFKHVLRTLVVLGGVGMTHVIPKEHSTGFQGWVGGGNGEVAF